MKTLYLDLGMGAAGDMLSAALLELLPEPERFLERLNALGIPGVVFSAEAVQKCGIRGTHVTVTVDGEEEREGGADIHPHLHGEEDGHEHHHHGMQDVEHIICDHLQLPDRVREDVIAVYRLIAEAESAVHGVPVTDVHFHEVGTMDAIADITAVCLLMAELAPERVIASPVHVGSGHVRCAHGRLPVPAPATACILQGVPIYGGSISGELCTPTGAALLKHFVSAFGDMPVMRVSAVGYGMGKKDFETANCVRAMLGETEDGSDAVCELSCNLDDMTGEKIGFAMERIFEAGALDVYTVPIGMKKSRPGVMLCALCREEDRAAVVRAIFQHTTTIGIRAQKTDRCILRRSIDAVETPYGTIRRKNVSGYGVHRAKYEFEDLAAAARAHEISIAEVERSADRAAEKQDKH